MSMLMSARARWAVPVLCFLWATAGVAFAAVPLAPDLAPAELRQALNAAWSSLPSTRAAQSRLDAAVARAEAAAKPLYNPELELSREDDGETRTTAGVNLMLDLSGKRRARAAVGQSELTLAQNEYRLHRAEFTRNWLDAWAIWQASERQLALSAQHLELSQRFASLAERQFNVGDISRLEKDLAVLARDEAQADYASAQVEVADAQERFAIVGGTATVAARFPSATALPVPTGVLGPDQLIALPEWQIGLAARDTAANRAVVARRDRRLDPTLGLLGGRREDGLLSDRIVGLSLTIPLPIRNTYRAELTAALADADAASADSEQLQLALTARAERARASYIAVRGAWLGWQKNEVRVAERAALLERLRQAGELSTADTLVQLKQTLDTAQAGHALEGRAWQSFVDYLFATGQLDRWTGFEPLSGDSRP
jgi:outer membrane protein, heavy metal efflux system